jgi:hypothetical protein
LSLDGEDMPWMPTNSEGKPNDSHVMLGVIIAGGLAVMFMTGIPWARSFLYSLPVAVVVALGLRYWHDRHGVDLIQLGYKNPSNRD